MSWFKRDRKSIDSSAEDRRVLTEGLWIKCEGCREPVWKKDLEANNNLCPKCGFHYRITAYERLDLLLDEGWTEFDSTLYSTDPLKFRAAKALTLCSAQNWPSLVQPEVPLVIPNV